MLTRHYRLLLITSASMKKLAAQIFSLMLLAVLTAPLIGYAQPADAGVGYGPVIPCDGVNVKCGFTELVAMAQNVIKYLVYLSTLAVLIIGAIQGFKLMTSQGNPGAMKEARAALLSVFKGYVIILVAWVAVYTILNALVDPKFSLLESLK